MKLGELLDVFITTLKISGKKNNIFLCNGKEYDITSLIYDATNLKGWCYKDLNLSDIRRVCCCKDCVHYKRFRKKGQLKSRSKYLCELDKSQRNPEYYCASATWREER